MERAIEENLAPQLLLLLCMDSVAIRLVKVRAGYEKQRPVLKDISLDIRQGELVAVLGMSGSGKSTLLRTIAGILESFSGKVEVLGKEVSEIDPRQRSIGFVFQHLALFPNMTVLENIDFGLRYRSNRKEERQSRVRELLEALNIAGVGKKMPSELSGGQAQRVALARALAPKPRVLLLDEPFSSLDRPLADVAREIVTQLHRKNGLTTVLVTHDREGALAIADRIVVLGSSGRVVQNATAREVYEWPQSPEVAALTGLVNILSGRVVWCSDSRVGVEVHGSILEARWRGEGEPPKTGLVQLVVRPEWLKLATDDKGTKINCVVGAVTQIVNTGNRRYVHILAGDTPVIVECNGTEEPVVGASVRVGVEADCAIAFENGGAIW